MTLSTNILVMAPVDVTDLHSWINTNLLNAPSAVFSTDPHGFRNQMGQGLDALLHVSHNNGEPWPLLEVPDTSGMSEEDAEDATWEIEYDNRKAGAYADIDFDTAYGYSKDGMGCTELHALYIVRLAREYFEPRNLSFKWRNEYSGEWYEGLDRDGMQKFLGSGDEAMNWFTNIAEPAIQAMIDKDISSLD